MGFTAKDVQEFREMTGAGMLDCKKALAATDGDREKAVEWLRERGVAVAAKKASRIASDGLIGSYRDDKVGVLAELNCETDFVANTDGFKNLISKTAEVIGKGNISSVEEWLNAETGEGTITELINEYTTKCGEKISARRFEKFTLSGYGIEEIYLHNGGKIGVMLEVETSAPAIDEIKELAHGIAMHIAAFSPAHIYVSEVPADYIEKEKAVLLAAAKNDPKNAGKPDNILEKMLMGRLNKGLKEICLVEQAYALDPSVTVGAAIANLEKKSGISIKLIKFVRLVMGEGIEKREDNLADEVAKLSGK
ncbi:MAG: elongation factor Ts [Clostridia bacterium]|nr:elongation factor Ts [Clostridia bacterium]